MGATKPVLGAWSEVDGVSIRRWRNAHGEVYVASIVRPSGWDCAQPGQLLRRGMCTGSETGAAGQAAADTAALAMGWELEGGPVTLPDADPAIDRLQQRVQEAEADRWRRIVDVARSVEPGRLDMVTDDDMEDLIANTLRRFPLLVKERDDARTEVERLRDENATLEQDLSKSHGLLTAALIPLGTLPERLRQLLERTRRRLVGHSDGEADDRLRAELDNERRLAQFWASEATRVTDSRDADLRDLQRRAGEREQALLQALGDIAVIWSRGVRP